MLLQPHSPYEMFTRSILNGTRAATAAAAAAAAGAPAAAAALFSNAGGDKVADGLKAAGDVLATAGDGLAAAGKASQEYVCQAPVAKAHDAGAAKAAADAAANLQKEKQASHNKGVRDGVMSTLALTAFATALSNPHFRQAACDSAAAVWGSTTHAVRGCGRVAGGAWNGAMYACVEHMIPEFGSQEAEQGEQAEQEQQAEQPQAEQPEQDAGEAAQEQPQQPQQAWVWNEEEGGFVMTPLGAKRALQEPHEPWAKRLRQRP